MADLKYPIGKFVEDPDVTPEKRNRCIADLEATAALFRLAVAGLTDAQLDTPYRDGGWTPRQVVHHMADSHANSYIRFRLALTENEPTMQGYSTDGWSSLPDAKSGPVQVSIDLLEAIHRRWILLLRAMKPEEFRRTIKRPSGEVLTLDRLLQTYTWHGKHHAAHITGLRERMGWK
jgi:hypothetical protein